MTTAHKKPETEEQRLEREAHAMVKTCYEDKKATINGRDYEFTIASHQQRLKVFAFLSGIAPQLKKQDMSFLGTKEWSAVEGVISNLVMYDGSLLSRRSTHWEEFPEDFLMFISIALQVISYPFMRGKSTA